MSIRRFEAMGCEVVVAGADDAALTAIRDLFEMRDARFSRFRAGSELNRVNSFAGMSVRVSLDFRHMVDLALFAAEETGGVVSPTVGAAIEATGYVADFWLLRDDGCIPDGADVPDWRSVRLIGDHLVRPRGVTLDLNGVVKSATVDDALALLSGDGFISAGGDVGTRGPTVVALPADDTVRVVHGALATSGTDKRRWVRGGRVQHHLIDPRTGAPSQSRWTHVTACGATCVAADIAAKTGFLLDDEGPEWLDERGIPARFVDVGGDVHTNDAWRSSLRERERVCT